MEYIYFDLIDTAILCHLDIKDSTLGNDEVQARCPFCEDYKYRMYLSRQSERPVFWCHNCGTGGNAVTLYARFNPYGLNLSTKEAYELLLQEPSVRRTPATMSESSSRNASLRVLSERSNIYLELLSMLKLEKAHYINLHNRGLSDDIIKGNMYRSIPTDYQLRMRVMNHLAKKFDLFGMPGFYTDSSQRWQMANCQHSGILIPVCTKDNEIQGLQIRLDNAPPKVSYDRNGNKIIKAGDRFRWLSTGGESNGKPYYQNGTGISSFIHVVGDLRSDTVHLTEGPLKSDIASFLSEGELFVGLTGVQNTRYLADVIRQLHPKRIIECIDMDVRTNPLVQRAQSKIRSICMPLCEEYRAFTWPIEQKGIDDWLLFEKLKREHGLTQT